MKKILILSLFLSFFGCGTEKPVDVEKLSYYNLQEPGVKSGGIKMIPVHGGKYKVWTKRVGNSPRIKVLLLHGGPAATHEYFESFDSYFPQEGIEYYYYDQLGSYYSDQPTDTSLWNLPRF
ncbi:MAG TPA: proline iminopeptidase, partial [Cyclobacteriaceae bacterium]|nr:proline iminopeptidase [Cyclobacteriaceae bacterium]